MLSLEEQLNLYQRFKRVESVAKELAALVRRDHTLYEKISSRTRRWIKTQDKLQRVAEDLKDEELRTLNLRQKALAKLTKVDKDLLGIPQDEDEPFT